MGKRGRDSSSASPSGADLEGRLRAVAGTFGRALTSQESARLLRFVELLHTWNARINLTGARSPELIIEEQLPDSFALAALVPQGARLVDVGSGGGLPAVPFALLRPDVGVTLAEPRSRRRAFLATALRELGLAAALLPDRDDQLRAGQHDAASARAVFAPDAWVARGFRLVVPSGLLFLFLADDTWSPPPAVELVAERRYPVGARGHRLASVRRSPGA